MRRGIWGLAAAGCVLAGLAGTPARSAPVSANAQRDATAVTHAIFQAVDMQSVVLASIQGTFDESRMQMPRPEWNPLFKQAMLAELVRHMPDMEASFGRTMAGSYSESELRAGAAFLASPIGLRLMSMLKAKTSGQTVAELTPGEQATLQQAARDPELARFMDKFGKGLQIPSSVTQDFVALILPDVFIRFGEAAKAAETRRAASAAP